MNRTSSVALSLVAASLVAGIACGGGGGGGYSNTPAAPAAPAGPAAVTIRITASGVGPKEVKVEIGSTVTFVNDDSRSHEMMSDPHPAHSGCPEINAVGNLNPGQTRQTGAFASNRTCGFHDNRQDGETSLRGIITVGLGGDPPDRY